MGKRYKSTFLTNFFSSSGVHVIVGVSSMCFVSISLLSRSTRSMDAFDDMIFDGETEKYRRGQHRRIKEFLETGRIEEPVALDRKESQGCGYQGDLYKIEYHQESCISGESGDGGVMQV